MVATQSTVEGSTFGGSAAPVVGPLEAAVMGAVVAMVSVVEVVDVDAAGVDVVVVDDVGAAGPVVALDGEVGPALAVVVSAVDEPLLQAETPVSAAARSAMVSRRWFMGCPVVGCRRRS